MNASWRATFLPFRRESVFLAADFMNCSLLQSVKLVPDLYEMFTCTLLGLRQDRGKCPGDPVIEVGWQEKSHISRL